MINSADIFKASILIVDDQNANVLLLSRMLVSAGYTSVASTMNPLEVCELHRQHCYDLILLDLLMPGMDGFQVLEGLKEIEPDSYPPVLVITAQPNQKLRALEAGARDFVSKPFDLSEVLLRVHNMLEVRLLHKRLYNYNEVLEQRVRERTAVMAEEIEVRKQAEEALQISEVRYRRLVESVTDYIYSVKVEQGCAISTIHGPGCVAVTGHAPEEFAADPELWSRMVYEEDREIVMMQSRQLFAGDIPPPMEHRIIHKDGSIRWVRNTSVPFFDKDGQLVAYDGMITNITERKLAEIALQFKNLLLITQQEVSIDGIRIVDEFGKIISYNQRFIEMWEIPSQLIETGSDEQVLQFTIGKTTEPETFLQRIHYLYSHNEEKSRDEIALLDGRTFDRYSAPLSGQDGKYYGRIWYYRDMTERKQLEKKLKEYAENLEIKVRDRTKQLEDVNVELQTLNDELVLRRQEAEMAKRHADKATRAKSDFLANMSHELRTPLNSIIGFSQVLKKAKFGELTEKQDEFLGYVITSGKHLLNLINDILDLAKVEAGKVELEVSFFNVQATLNSSLNMLKEKAMKHRINLMLDMAPDVETEIEGDERRFKQILFNLLSNAVKFTPDGGVVCLRAQKSGKESLEISVEDTGIGMKKEDMPRLFKEFSQIESSFDKNYEGTGLGLALTKQLVELHGGRVWAESDYGKGSRFAFIMPVRHEEGKHDT
ncbi:MAG: ATP-binding protein [Deltaproteobacteria bacterium]|nr:ATP-binding protein [Deltaproteobacteria bacterium]